MESPVSAAHLAAARAAVQTLMTESVVIKRPTVAKSATGGNKPAFAPVATTICRKLDLPSDEQQTENQLKPVKLAEFLLPYDTDVREQDQLVVGSETFEVIGIETRSTLVQQRVEGKRAAA